MHSIALCTIRSMYPDGRLIISGLLKPRVFVLESCETRSLFFQNAVFCNRNQTVDIKELDLKILALGGFYYPPCWCSQTHKLIIT